MNVKVKLSYKKKNILKLGHQGKAEEYDQQDSKIYKRND